jgi:hypothetical protein
LDNKPSIRDSWQKSVHWLQAYKLRCNNVIALLFLFAFSLFFLKQAPAQTTSVNLTSSGSYTVPAGVTKIKVEAWGGGGGTSRPANQNTRGGGGGGAYSRSSFSVTPGASISYVVGAGGTTSGTNGGDSYWENTSTLLAKGGSGNTGTSTAAGGQASAGVGAVKYSGGTGAAQVSTMNAGGGGGGAGSEGDGNDASGSTGGASRSENGGAGGDGRTGSRGEGEDGFNYGGGGGGSSRQGGTLGTSGAPGLIRVTYSTFTLASTAFAVDVCSGSSATVQITSTNTGLPAGVYSISYTLSGANTGTFTASNVAVSGSTTTTGSFTTPALNSTGSTTVTINNIESDDYGNNISSNNTATLTVHVPASGPTFGSKSPNLTDVCEGVEVSATFTGGTGGVGCADVFRYSIDNGSNWSVYLPGDPVSTVNATVVIIQGKRDNCSAGSGCAGTAFVDLVEWGIIASPTATITSANTSICKGESTSISGTVTALGDWTLTLSNGGGTVTGTGSGSWSKSVAPETTTSYTVESLSDENCTAPAAKLTGSTLVTVKRLNLEVSQLASEGCPDLLESTTPPFEPENGSYHHGATEVVFRVTRELSVNSNWSFDFEIEGIVVVTSAASNVTKLTLAGDDANPPVRTGNLLSGNIDAGENTYVDLIFEIENTPGSEQIVDFNISNPDDGTGCGETETGSENDNSAQYTILSMPVIGSFD